MINKLNDSQIKKAIIVMTALIVIALGFVIYGITKKSDTPKQLTATINLMKEAKVTMIGGYGDNLALYVAAPKGDNIYLMNAKNGDMVGRLVINRQ